MRSLDTLTVVIAVAGSCGIALLGWLLGPRIARWSRREGDLSRRWRGAIVTFVAFAAVCAAVAAPIVSVFWTIVALNFILGRRENVPFSTYPMFSKPTSTAWALRFEGSDGELIAIGKIGLAPHIMRKRFVTELRTARKRGVGDMDAARLSAASVIATLVEQHRPPGGPLAASPITIVLMEYVLDSGRLLTVRTPIMETRP